MYAKSKRRRVEKLVEKYAQRRNIEDGQEEEEDDLFNCPASCSFSPISCVPGVFSVDGLIEGFDLLQRYFADLAPSVLPLVQPHLLGNELKLISGTKGNKSRKISCLQEWSSLKPKLEKLCPIMLPFVAQIVETDVSTAQCTSKQIKSESAVAQLLVNGQTRQHLIQLKVRNKERTTVTACAFSQNLLAIGLVDGTIFLFDLANLPENFAEPSLVQLDANGFTAVKRKRVYIHRNRVNRILSLAFLKDVFVSNDHEGVIALWDGSNGAVLRKFLTRNTFCYDISLCDQMESTGLFLSAHGDGAARLWMIDRTNYLRLLVHDYPVKQVALRSEIAATSTEIERAVRIWDINTGKMLRVLEQMDTHCWAIKFVNEKRVWAITETGVMYLSDIFLASTLAKQKLDMAPKARLTSLSIGLDNSLILLLGTNSSKMFCVDLSCQELEQGMLKVNCLIVDNKLLGSCPMLAAEWCAVEKKISILVG